MTDSAAPASARVAVALATIHPGDVVADAAASVLASDFPLFEVHVVDQRPPGTPSPRLTLLLADPRVRYHRQLRLGLSAALNLVAASTTADVIATTGDDCTVRPDWVTELLAAFDADDRVGVVFGNVVPAPTAAQEGFVPGCLIAAEAVIDDLRQIARVSGTTACMAVRRRVWEALGGFDEQLGVGARLRSAEDLDFALRALLRGHRVLQTPAPEVEHRTPVPWRDRSAVIRRNWFGSGAAYAKCAKLAPVRTTVALARLGLRWRSGGSAVAGTYGPRPDRGAMLAGFAAGFAAGLVQPVDRRSQHFRRSHRHGP